MMSALLYFVLLPSLVVAWILGGFWFILRVQRRRREERQALDAWAAARGWLVAPRDPAVAGIVCPPTRTRGSAAPVLRGQDPAGLPALAFEWTAVVSTYEGEYGSGPQTESWHVVAAVVGAAPAPTSGPAVQITPRRRSGHLLRAGAGLVTGVTAFDETFALTADDPAAAAALVPREVLAWWATDPRTARTGVRLQGDWAVCWRYGRLTTRSLDEVLGVVDELRARLAVGATRVPLG